MTYLTGSIGQGADNHPADILNTKSLMMAAVPYDEKGSMVEEFWTTEPDGVFNLEFDYAFGQFCYEVTAPTLDGEDNFHFTEWVTISPGSLEETALLDRAAMGVDKLPDGPIKDRVQRLIAAGSRVRRSGKCSNPELLQHALRIAKHHFPIYSRSSVYFHSYCHATLICDGYGNRTCNVGRVYEALKRYPAPMIEEQDVGVVEDGKVSRIQLLGSISHKLLPLENAIINQTNLGDHILHPGVVLRLVQEYQGGIYVVTYGEGIGDLERSAEIALGHDIGDLIGGSARIAFGFLFGRGFLGLLNEEFAATVWSAVDKNIIDEVMKEE